MSVQNPTIIVFSRGARREREAKRLLPHASSHEVRLHAELIERSLSIARAVGVEVVINSPARVVSSGVRRTSQEGNSFSARLQNAVDSARNPRWVVMAADCPELRVDYLQSAVEAVNGEPDTVVIGPSGVGGVYLVASNCDIADVIRRVRWRTRAAREDLIRLAAERGKKVVILERSDDLNRPSDLDRWLKRSTSRSEDLLIEQIRAELKSLLRLTQTPAEDCFPLLRRPSGEQWSRPPPPLLPA